MDGMETEQDQTAQEFTAQGENISKKQKKRDRIRARIWEIDVLRCLCILLMIADHIMFDFDYFGTMWMYQLDLGGWFYRASLSASWYWEWPVRVAVREIVIGIFFLTSGISSSFSRNNWARGIKLAIVALVITVATTLIDRYQDFGLTIRFGVLHCFAVCILFTALLDLLLKRVKPAWIRYAVPAALAVVAISVGVYLMNNPVSAGHDFFAFLGITSDSYYSSDYCPVLPWLGVFLFGYLAGLTVYRKRKSLIPALDRQFWRPAKFMGRHALVIYVAHQVIIFCIFYVMGIALGLH